MLRTLSKQRYNKQTHAHSFTVPSFIAESEIVPEDEEEEGEEKKTLHTHFLPHHHSV